jgi:DNA-binding response OmpR family regulator
MEETGTLATALIIDDDEALAKTVTDFLNLEGVRSVSLRDLDNLLAVAAAVSPDVIVIDLMLAALSGVEIAAELRGSSFADIPRIAISSSPFLLEIADESDLFDYVLPKPLDLEQLLILITESVGGGETAGSAE